MFFEVEYIPWFHIFLKRFATPVILIIFIILIYANFRYCPCAPLHVLLTILQLICPLHNPSVSTLYVFLTIWLNGTDTENIKLVFCAVKDTIMQTALKEFGMA